MNGGWKDVVINGVRVQTMDVREASRRWWKMVLPPSKEVPVTVPVSSLLRRVIHLLFGR